MQANTLSRTDFFEERSNMMKQFGLKMMLGAALLGAGMVGTACRTSPSAGEGSGSGAETGAPFDAADQFGLKGAPLKGAENALVTIVEYSDFECPFCARVNPTLKQIFDTPEYAGKVRVIFKHNPLPFHKNAPLAAEASLAAHAQGKFWEMHDKLFENMKALTRPDLEKYATEIGLDMVKFKEALDKNTYKDAVAKDLADAGKAGVKGTPHFLVNGKAISGAQPFDAFKTIIDVEIKEMETLTKGGKKLGEAFGERVKANFKLEAAEAKPAAPAGPDPADELFVPVGDSPIKGDPAAAVTLVIFSEYQCPFCARVEATLKELQTKYGKDLRIVWKDNPLPFHDKAEPAARAGLAAHAQGKFWEFHDKLFANQQALGLEDLKKHASELGLNMAKFEADMNAPTAAASIKEDQALATRLAARGTPHFFVNGFRLRGAQPAPKFIEIIDRELARAKAKIAAGTPASGVYDALQASANKGEAKMLAGSAPGAGKPEAPKAAVKIPIGNAPAKGSANAKVTIITYTDFECPFCSRFATNLDEAIKGDPNVRIVVKQFPLAFHKNADLAAQAGLAANAQGKFWEYHDKMFANMKALTRPDLEGYAQELGLNMAKFKEALDKGTYAQQVKDEMAEGQKFGVQGTPSWFVNGVFQSGALPPDAIKAKIAEFMTKPAP
jgi:protein-disulfide isomerase